MRYITNLSAFLLVFISSALIGQTQLSKTIFFDFDDYKISEESKIDLLNFKIELASYTESYLKIIGHADQDGSDDYNLKLSQKRAESVKRFVTTNKFSSTEVSINYLGESDLVLPTSDSKSKQKNRRVVVIAEVYKYETAAEMLTQLVPNNDQKRRINQETESKFELKKGTKVNIPANAFCYADGSPVKGDSIDILFKEVFDYTDMVDESLFTQTENRILETGGMIYIEARQNEKELKLQDGKRIELLFPKQKLKEGMELFTGKKDENVTIWKETGEAVMTLKEETFILVDLADLLNFNFEDQDSVELTLAPMPPFPHPKRIAYPPYKKNYTEERYIEEYKKYEAVMAIHNKDELDRPERLKKWEEEVDRREKILYKHKKEFVTEKLSIQLRIALSRIEKKQYTISNDKLIGSIVAFLGKEAGKIRYEENYYRDRIFEGSIKEVLKYKDFRFPDYKNFSGQAFFPNFNEVLKIVQKNITTEKYKLGYVDENIFSNYIVSTSNLGWINCDRFFNIPDIEKTNLEVAEYTKDLQFYLVFKNIKSLIRPETVENKIVFTNIPKGEDVKIISLNFKNSIAYMATQDLKVGSGEEIVLSYEKKGIKELREVLSEI